MIGKIVRFIRLWKMRYCFVDSYPFWKHFTILTMGLRRNRKKHIITNIITLPQKYDSLSCLWNAIIRHIYQIYRNTISSMSEIFYNL